MSTDKPNGSADENPRRKPYVKPEVQVVEGVSAFAASTCVPTSTPDNCVPAGAPGACHPTGNPGGPCFPPGNP